MNKKAFYGAAFTALMFSACSQDIDAPAQPEGVIAFNVTNAATSRAMQSHCNTNLPASFNVAAYTTADGAEFFTGDLALRNGSSNVYTTSPERLWPSVDLDFHAWANDGGTYAYADGKPSFVDFAPDADVTKQLDLLYAVQKGQNRSVGNVKLNFRHALSQIVFSARNEAKRYSVKISGVHVGHLADKGTFTYGNGNTTENYENHTDTPNGTENIIKGGQGTWALGSALTEYATTFGTVDLPSPTQETPAFTAQLTGVAHDGGVDGSLLLLPQTQGAWAPAAAADGQFNGAYFLLDVEMTLAEGLPLYKGQIALPVDIAWEQGTRYRYIFVFTDNGSAGWTPDPENPQPVLANVKYEVTADDFVPVNPGELDPGQNPGTTVTPQPVKYNYSVRISDGTAIINNFTATSTESEYTFDLSSVATPSKDGYEFTGWLNSLTGAVTEALPATVTVSKDAATATFTAQWQRIKQEIAYKVTFSANVPDNIEYAYLPEPLVKNTTDETVTFTAPQGPIVAAAAFIGWATSADATEADYQRGDVITLTADKPQITLYALWQDGQHVIGGGNLGGENPLN